MLKAKMDLVSRKKTLKTLKHNELDALNSGHIVEIEKFNKLKKYLAVSCSAETNCKNIKQMKRTMFLKWRSNILIKLKNIKKLSKILTCATFN
jgi:hypothetical protein